MSFLLPTERQSFDGVTPPDARMELINGLGDEASSESRERLMEAQRAIGRMLAQGELRSFILDGGVWRALAPRAWWENGVRGERSLVTGCYETYSNSASAREIEGKSWCFDKREWEKVRSALLGEQSPKRGPKKKYDKNAFIDQAKEIIRDEGAYMPGVFQQSDLVDRLRVWAEKGGRAVPERTYLNEVAKEAHASILAEAGVR